MARRTKSGFEQVAGMPWPIGISVGLVGYIAIRHGIGWYFGLTNNPYTSGLGKLAARGVYAPLGWILLIGCWTAALVSFFGRRSRRRLLDTQTGIDSLRQMSWRQFEQLAGEAFGRQGYSVEETGGGGADGGIDLVLRKDSRSTLVQCKQWQNTQVGVKAVREMYGLLMHHQAAAVKIVALGDYTSEARRFAQGKPIELVNGGELLATVCHLQRTKVRATSPMDAPLAITASMVAGLLVIAALSPSSAPAPVVVAPVVTQTTYSAPAPSYQPHPSVAPTRRPRATIHGSDAQDKAELREWKKRNAESMKIIEKSTKEMPLL